MAGFVGPVAVVAAMGSEGTILPRILALRETRLSRETAVIGTSWASNRSLGDRESICVISLCGRSCKSLWGS